MPAFTSPPNMQQFQSLVWDLVRQISRGRVATYGQIAMMLPPPPGVEIEAYRAFGPRWVGGAMANCPDDVPWQRVINAKGEISPRPGAERQRGESFRDASSHFSRITIRSRTPLQENGFIN